MVVAKFTMDEGKKRVSLRVRGHAGLAPHGFDILCASVSILTYTLAQNLKGIENRGGLKYPLKFKTKDGDAIITCRAKDDEEYSELLHIYCVIQTGFILLAHNYPQFVAVEMFGEA